MKTPEEIREISRAVRRGRLKNALGEEKAEHILNRMDNRLVHRRTVMRRNHLTPKLERAQEKHSKSPFQSQSDGPKQTHKQKTMLKVKA